MRSKNSSIIVLCVLLAILVAGVYLRTGSHQFVNLDDQSYVSQNPHIASGLNSTTIAWAFSSVYSSNWHPVTWLSHMVDVQLYGMNPRGHHLTNVIIHTISSLLLLLFLVRHTGSLWRSSFVATLFAIHPLHVESVAWVSERKDLLCGFFWFLTLLAYGEFTVSRRRLFYVASLAFFVLGLMSKPMIVTLPVIMLLMDVWPLDRFRREIDAQRRMPVRILTLIQEKIPFLAGSLMSCAITIYAQQKEGSLAYSYELPFWMRFKNAVISYVQYIGKTFWPHDLAVYYPYPASIPAWQFISSLTVLLLVSAAVWFFRRHSYLVTGWLWFLITLLPVIGFIQVGNQAMADRYSYIPIIGLFMAVAWGVPELVRGQRGTRILALCAGIIIIVSSALTWQQIGYWRDSVTLFRHTLGVTSANAFIHYNLGLTLHVNEDLDAAIVEYRKALAITPNDKDAHNALGIALHGKGFLNDAFREYTQALRLDPNDMSTRINLGLLYFQQGDLDAAIREFQTALSLNPDSVNAADNLNRAIAAKRRQSSHVQN